MSTPRVYRNRLLKLADKLDTVPPERFDYSVWVGEDYQGAADLSCGTTACALGWATTIPSFRKLGLRLLEDGWGGVEVGNIGGRGLSETEDAFTAGEELFGLTRDESYYLFAPEGWLGKPLPIGPNHNATAKQVAKHIRRFVNWKYPELKGT